MSEYEVNNPHLNSEIKLIPMLTPMIDGRVIFIDPNTNEWLPATILDIFDNNEIQIELDKGDIVTVPLSKCYSIPQEGIADEARSI